MATRGVKLDAQVLTDRLGTAVEDCFAVLQSQLDDTLQSASVELSAQFEDKAEQTVAAALEARRRLGWECPHPAIA